MDLYDLAFEKLCELEGFKSDLAGDPGGRTIWGISERYFPEDVRKMTFMSPEQAKEHAKEFYRKHFWDPISHLDPPLSIVAFLMGVNAPGPTKHAISEYDDYRDILLHLCKYYSNIVSKNPNLAKFLRGWINRVVKVWEFIREVNA